MGRQHEQLTVRVRVSRHNSEQDKIDDALWAELWTEVTRLITQPRFASIDPNIE